MSTRGRTTAWLIVGVLAGVGFGVACTAAGPGPSTSPGTSGTLAGRVVELTRAPTQPPGGSAATSPVPGVTLVLSRADGTAVGRVTTGPEGRFRATLPPGTYSVSLVPRTGLEFTKSLPATVAIHAGRETWLEVVLDSGVR